MTTAALDGPATAHTLVGEDADLLRRINDLLRNHPAGSSYRLLLAPTTLTVGEDEVLVQETDTARGVVELHPRKLNDVALEDVLHATQVISPTDEDFTRYAESPQATDYYPTTRPDGSRGHLWGYSPDGGTSHA